MSKLSDYMDAEAEHQALYYAVWTLLTGAALFYLIITEATLWVQIPTLAILMFHSNMIHRAGEQK